MQPRTMIDVGVVGLITAIAVWLLLKYGTADVATAAKQSQSQDGLHNLTIAAQDYESTAGFLPRAATVSSAPPISDLHGWQTQLLPYVGEASLHARIDHRRPWTDPLNEPLFRHNVALFENTAIAETTGPTGLDLTHDSANSRVLTSGPPLRLTDISDGLSETLLLGEINTAFPPWGQPRNVRDPAVGLHKGPTSFGGPWSDRSTNFSVLDGRVNRLNSDIDPAVLRALATPAGGEAVKLP